MRPTRLIVTGFLFLVLTAAFSQAAFPPQAATAPRAADLLPKPGGWMASEAPRIFVPDTLFEYINGAAENFLSYDFVELAVGLYRGADGKAEMTVEIYDMGAPENAFGIYGSERYPESRFLPVGVQGYIEDGVLNFFAGRFYVKLMAYEAGEKTEAALKAFAAGVLRGIPAPGAFPLPVRAFDPAGLVANSEKFILRDFLGLNFLTRGFVAGYRSPEAGEYDAFVIETPSGAEMEKMFTALTGHFTASALPAGSPTDVVRLKDPYLLNVLVSKAGRFICGAVKVGDGSEATAEKTIRATAKALAGK